MIKCGVAAVTGAPGWLGTRLVEALTGQQGSWPNCSFARVRCLTQPGTDVASLRSVGAETIPVDLRDSSGLAGALSNTDIVFHLAGIIHPRRISELYALNTEGTRRMLEEAVRAGVRRFIFVSSNSAGGFQSAPAKLMDEGTASPYLHYGRSKRLAELAVLEAARQGTIEGVVVRPCWFYGPRFPDRQLRFYRMIASGHPILFGSGNYLRSLSYIDNTVQGLILAATSPSATGQVYWIADERPYPVVKIYDTIARQFGLPSWRPRRVPEWICRLCQGADAALQNAGFYIPEIHVGGEFIQNIACTIEKAQRELGYKPTVELDEGTKRSIEWARSNGKF